MAFTFSLTLGWLKHRFLSAKRVINNWPPDYFIEKYKQSPALIAPGQKLSALPTCCKICSFSMAELILENGWSIRTCSATGLEHILTGSDFKQWQKNIFDSRVKDLSSLSGR